MGLLLTILLGGLAGLLASKIMKTDAEMGVVANIVVGIVGAFLANLILSLLAPSLGLEARLDTISIEGFLVAVAGAVGLLALVKVFTRRNNRV